MHESAPQESEVTLAETSINDDTVTAPPTLPQASSYDDATLVDTLYQFQRQLRETQALAGLGSWEWDVATDRVTWTDELYRIFGLDLQTFGGTFRAYLERVHPEDRPTVRALVEEAYRNGRPFGLEERIVRPDGEVRILRSQGRVVRDDDGKITHLVGACLDITDLRMAERQAIQLAREQSAREAAESLATRSRMLVRASELLASSLDFDSTLQQVAELAVPAVADWCIIHFLDRNSTLRRIALAHSDAERPDGLMRLLDRCPITRDTRFGIWRVIESGEAEVSEDYADEFPDRTGEGEDLTKYRRDLRIGSSVTVSLLGRGRSQGALTLAQSKSARRISENEIWVARELGHHIALAIENALLHRELEDRNRMLEDHSIALQRQSARVRLEASRRERLLAMLERTNEQLERRTLEAEQANRVKSEFLAMMSHELRTPLNAISGYAELMHMGLYGPVTPKQSDALDRIQRNQHALVVLVNDVLNFTKLEAGKLEIELTDVSVEKVILDLEKVVGPQLAEKGIRYTCNPADSGLQVRGDPERIEQVLRNLLTNAIKFTPEGGEISIRVDVAGNQVRILVADTGIGIAAERLETIFDPFVQIDRRPGGTSDRGVGLGLAISRNLAEAMDGTLQVESSPGKGSTFTLTLARSA